MDTVQDLSEGLAQAQAGPAGWAVEAGTLTRRFGEVQALAGVSLQIRAGEFFCLLGPSGCGKTTLLRMIAGLDVPDSGTLRLCGRDMMRIPANQRPVNTVFQSYALFPHLTARENVGFGLRMKKVDKREIRERVERVMSLVQISALANRRPAQLSGGEKQRVALARAIVNEPKVLLLDEPLGALDLKLRKELQLELHQLQRRLSITFIHVTHDQDEALTMSDRIAVMNAGRLEQVAKARELYERPRSRFVAQFVGACNLFQGKVADLRPAHVIIETALGQLLASHDQPNRLTCGDTVTVAIRPENVILAQTSSQPDANSLSGTVEAEVYNGVETHYSVRVGDRQVQATQLNQNQGARGAAEGERVVCRLPPDSLLVLER